MRVTKALNSHLVVRNSWKLKPRALRIDYTHKYIEFTQIIRTLSSEKIQLVFA